MLVLLFGAGSVVAKPEKAKEVAHPTATFEKPTEDEEVKVKRTKHFTIWMDTISAAKKFPKALEQTYEDVRKMLGLDEMEDRLPVYIFQNPNGYWDFCERHLHWARVSAEASAGHGSGRYFATYFQSNKAPTVTHELTHSMIHRVRWFSPRAEIRCSN